MVMTLGLMSIKMSLMVCAESSPEGDGVKDAVDDDAGGNEVVME